MMVTQWWIGLMKYLECKTCGCQRLWCNWSCWLRSSHRSCSSSRTCDW